MKKTLVALALGTFCLGMAEYVLMGILPYLAADFRVSISEAGYLISAYALGVCAGAPFVALCLRRWPLKRLLCLLCGLMIVSSAAMAACPVPHGALEGARWPFWLMMALRFVGGLPHGAYFGVGAIIADRVSPRGKSTFAVAVMCSGMTVANLLGIPLGTLFTDLISWRLVFAFACLCGVATLAAVVRWIPALPALPDHGVRGEFRFLRSAAPWLLIAATILGNGGVFCWYSYISPALVRLAGVPVEWMTLVMVLAGAGMVIGNLAGGRLSDVYGPGHTGRNIEVAIFVSLLLIALTAHWPWAHIPLMMTACGCLFAVSSPQQLLLLRYSEGGELMGGAMVQLAFNLGNAIGAWLGGLPIDEARPETYHYPAAVGSLLAAGGIVCYVLFCRRYEPYAAVRRRS